MATIIPYQRSWRPKAQTASSRWPTVAGVLLLVFLFGFPLAVEFGPPLVGCSVKGNISMTTGERIYHVPGQKYYAATSIDLFHGERWFCSEQAARAAGWRKSRI